MAKMIKKAQAGSKVPVSKLRKVADSLDYESRLKKQAAYNLSNQGKQEQASKTMAGGAKNAETAKRYRNIADKAEEKLKSTPKKKMKNGGSLTGLKASTKRDKGVDPKGAFTKVQKKTLAGAKGKTSLTKDKQLGATKMKCGGKMSKKK